MTREFLFVFFSLKLALQDGERKRSGQYCLARVGQRRRGQSSQGCVTQFAVLLRNGLAKALFKEKKRVAACFRTCIGVRENMAHDGHNRIWLLILEKMKHGAVLQTGNCQRRHGPDELIAQQRFALLRALCKQFKLLQRRSGNSPKRSSYFVAVKKRIGRSKHLLSNRLKNDRFCRQQGGVGGGRERKRGNGSWR
jgi:hypothetical protein